MAKWAFRRGAVGCALHRDRHQSSQSRFALESAAYRSPKTRGAAIPPPRSSCDAGEARRLACLFHLFALAGRVRAANRSAPRPKFRAPARARRALRNRRNRFVRLRVRRFAHVSFFSAESERTTFRLRRLLCRTPTAACLKDSSASVDSGPCFDMLTPYRGKVTARDEPRRNYRARTTRDVRRQSRLAKPRHEFRRQSAFPLADPATGTGAPLDPAAGT